MCVSYAFFLANDEVVLDLPHPLGAAGNFSGSGLGLGRVDKAAQLNDVLHGLDTDLHRLQRGIVEQRGFDFGRDRRVVDLFPSGLATGHRRARCQGSGQSQRHEGAS
jgi:hypothetical protein